MDGSNADRRQKGLSGRSSVRGRVVGDRSELGQGSGGVGRTDCVGPHGLLGGLFLRLKRRVTAGF